MLKHTTPTVRKTPGASADPVATAKHQITRDLDSSIASALDNNYLPKAQLGHIDKNLMPPNKLMRNLPLITH